ncbi:FAD-binding oxidoreductase [soil metagenome]
MTVPATVADELRILVGDAGVENRPDILERWSRDFSWLSPILARDLTAVSAEVAVQPRSTAEVVEVLRYAYQHRIPVTPRGAGTGNYGQAVPLAAGIVLETGRLSGVLDVDGETALVRSGTTFAALEQALAAYDREAAVFPSMLTSTVAGFLSGGNQGLGSIEFGSIWDGWVRELVVVGCVESPEPLAVSGSAIDRHLHAYGTTGVITEVRLQTAPKRERTVVFGAFEELRAATSAGRTLMDLAVPPRAISVDDRRIWENFIPHPGHDGAVLLRSIVEVSTLGAATRAIEQAGGHVTAIDERAIRAVTSSVYNHSTLRVHRADAVVATVQIRGQAIVDREDEVRAALPGARIHLDGNAPRVHGKGFSGLLISDWIDDQTLDTGMARLRELGVIVVNPHTWLVGSHGGLDRYQHAARELDPLGLLNPGKLPRPDLESRRDAVRAP